MCIHLFTIPLLDEGVLEIDFLSKIGYAIIFFSCIIIATQVFIILKELIA